MPLCAILNNYYLIFFQFMLRVLLISLFSARLWFQNLLRLSQSKKEKQSASQQIRIKYKNIVFIDKCIGLNDLSWFHFPNLLSSQVWINQAVAQSY